MDTTLTTLETVQDIKDYLLAVGTPSPSLHPDVNSDDPWKKWNGWNKTIASGIDAEGSAIVVEAMHFASEKSSDHFSVSVAGSVQGDIAYYDLKFPVVLFPAVSKIRHPEHTPRKFVNGMVATWVGEDGKRQVAIRRDYGWEGGEWQVAIHGFRRVSDAFIQKNATILEVPSE